MKAFSPAAVEKIEYSSTNIKAAEEKPANGCKFDPKRPLKLAKLKIVWQSCRGVAGLVIKDFNPSLNVCNEDTVRNCWAFQRANMLYQTLTN